MTSEQVPGWRIVECDSRRAVSRVVTVVLHLAAALIALLSAAGASSADESSSPLEFRVKDLVAFTWAPDSLREQLPPDSSILLFTLQDIASGDSASCILRLKPEAASRIRSAPWWRWVNMTASPGAFEIWTRGSLLCEGRLHSLMSSALPPPGWVVTLPMLAFDDERTIRLELHGVPGRIDDVATSAAAGPMWGRILKVLRAAGVPVK